MISHLTLKWRGWQLLSYIFSHNWGRIFFTQLNSTPPTNCNFFPLLPKTMSSSSSTSNTETLLKVFTFKIHPKVYSYFSATVLPLEILALFSCLGELSRVVYRLLKDSREADRPPPHHYFEQLGLMGCNRKNNFILFLYHLFKLAFMGVLSLPLE